MLIGTPQVAPSEQELHVSETSIWFSDKSHNWLFYKFLHCQVSNDQLPVYAAQTCPCLVDSTICDTLHLLYNKGSKTKKKKKKIFGLLLSL